MTTGFLAEPWHRHDHRCYWDHTRCGWVCPAEEVTEAETHRRLRAVRGRRDLVEYRDVVLQKDVFQQYLQISADSYAKPRIVTLLERSRRVPEPDQRQKLQLGRHPAFSAGRRSGERHASPGGCQATGATHGQED